MYIVTTNTKTNVENFLRKFDIDYFEKIYPESGFYGKSDLLNRLIEDSGCKKDNVVFIGDETRDIEAGKKSGIKTIAATWGLNGKDAFLTKNPDWLVETSGQLLKIFQ